VGEALPELERMLIEGGVRRLTVVGAHDRRVAPGVPAADPASFQHRHVGDAEHRGEIVRRRKPVPAATDDDGIIPALRLREADRLRPGQVPTQAVTQDGGERIGPHQPSPVRLAAAKLNPDASGRLRSQGSPAGNPGVAVILRRYDGFTTPALDGAGGLTSAARGFRRPDLPPTPVHLHQFLDAFFAY